MSQVTNGELLSLLSTNYNKSLTLYELVTSTGYDRNRALLNINELYTNYSSTQLFMHIHPELATSDVQNFCANFEEFYFELKQVFLHEDENAALLYEKLEVMKESFEGLTNSFNEL